MIRRVLGISLSAVMLFSLGAVTPISAADLLDVQFDVVRVSPVSVTIRVTMINYGKVLSDTPAEVKLTGILDEAVRTVKVKEILSPTTTLYDPVYDGTVVGGVYEPKIIDYTERTLYIEDKKELAEWTLAGGIEPEPAYIPYNSPKAILTRDAATKKADRMTFTIDTLPEQPKLDEKEPVKEPVKKIIDIEIQTGLLRIDEGYGSAGLLALDMLGRTYYDDTNSSWWDTAWYYSKRITIDNADRAENLIDFPVGVYLTSANFDFTKAQTNGEDIRFVDADEVTDLAYEIVSWDAAGEFAEIWVNVPQIDASSDTDYFTMYWGNSTCASGEDTAGTWNSGYVAVYHMNDNPADTTQILDSTANAWYLAKKGVGEPLETTGVVGKSQYFDGSNDYAQRTISAPNEITLEYYYTPLSDATSPYYNSRLAIHFSGSAGNYYGWIMQHTDTTRPSIVFASASNFSSNVLWNNIIVDTPTLLSCVATNGNQKLYQNGTQVKTGTANFTQAGGAIYFKLADAAYAPEKSVHEARYSNVARSASWIAATNAALRDTLLTYGLEQGHPEAPANLTVTRSGNNLDLAWTKGYLAVDTVIVCGLLGYPETIADGEIIYTGTAATFTYDGAASEAGRYYFRAWSSSDWGYSDDSASALWESAMLSLTLEILFVFALLILAYWRRLPELYLMGAVACLLFGYRWLANADYLYFGILAFGVGLLTLFRAVMAQIKR